MSIEPHRAEPSTGREVPGGTAAYPRIYGDGVPLVWPVPSRVRRIGAPVFITAFALLVAFNAYRTVKNLDAPGKARTGEWQSLGDFRNNAYYPALAFLDGKNPYDAAQYATYPVSETHFPWYSPLTLLVEMPFALLPYRVAELCHYAVSAALLPLTALLVLLACGTGGHLDEVFAVASAMMLSRPGQMTLRTGQSAVLLVMASCVALHFARSRPKLAGLGLALSTMKPTFGVPLGFLMLVRGDRRALGAGILLASALTLPVALLLVARAGGVGPLATMLVENYRSWYTIPVSNPATSVLRVDAVSFVSRLVGHPLGTRWELVITAAVLAGGAAGVGWLAARRGDPARVLSASLLCLTVLLCTYHQTYDLLLLVLPLTALAIGQPWAPRAVRWPLFLLLVFPCVDYLPSFPAQRLGLDGGWLLALLTVNAAALIAAWFAYLVLTFRSPASSLPRRRRP